MVRLRMIAAAFVLMSATQPLDMRTINSDYPPLRYQGGAVTRVLFVEPGDIDRICGKAPAPYTRAACVHHDGYGPYMVLPNPCGAQRPDLFAFETCHELGHVNGWNATHDN